jgi:hypothetical protein
MCIPFDETTPFCRLFRRLCLQGPARPSQISPVSGIRPQPSCFGMAFYLVYICTAYKYLPTGTPQAERHPATLLELGQAGSLQSWRLSTAVTATRRRTRLRRHQCCKVLAPRLKGIFPHAVLFRLLPYGPFVLIVFAFFELMLGSVREYARATGGHRTRLRKVALFLRDTTVETLDPSVFHLNGKRGTDIEFN